MIRTQASGYDDRRGRDPAWTADKESKVAMAQRTIRIAPDPQDDGPGLAGTTVVAVPTPRDRLRP